MALLKEWGAAGFPPSEFWKQTHRSYQALMSGARSRNYQAHNNLVLQAFMTAVFMKSEGKKIDTSKYMVDIETGEPLRKKGGSDTPAQEGLSKWMAQLRTMREIEERKK